MTTGRWAATSDAHTENPCCNIIHDRTDPAVGQPLCAECYDYLGHVLFTWRLPELWRRFTMALRRNLAIHLKAAGITPSSVKASFVKVVEMQARAIPHIHALIRLDPPDDPAGGTVAAGPAWEPPISAATLAVLIQQAARAVTLDVPNPDTNHSGDAAPLVVRFGTQIDTQPLRIENRTAPTESSHRVAGYLAKCVTKSLQDFGVAARRLSAEAIADLDVTDHVRAILTTIALLADVTGRDRGFDAVVIGEPARAFYGPQFALTFPVFTHYGVGLWVPEVGGAVDPGSEAHDLVMTLFGGMKG
ncbi:hypothetical protein LAUMK35_03411 [Mycobacterium pseudokansasii]|nr:hypothetical protein LAUMK35_03411 [Mycobacterium pseudokansasii]VAZ98066.1 hypothetical protein LAUMK21_03408 [Mycobacterium pseudokansasii]